MMRDVFVHPTALVETDDLGDGSRVWAFAHIMPRVQIGRNCNVGDHCFVESGVRIGDNATIKNGNMIWEGVVLEDGVFVGPGVSFTNDLYPRSPRLAATGSRYDRKESWLVETLVKRGATLGAAAVIRAGVTVGEFATVAAGAVVTRDVAPYALVVGNPAHFRKWVCQCGVPFDMTDMSATCQACGRSYSGTGDVIRLVGEN